MSEDFNPRRELFKRYKEAFAEAWKHRSSERQSRRYLSAEADFLPASLAVSERPTPIMPHVALWLFSSFVIIALVWSILGKIDVVVVASGKVLSGGKTKPVQSVDTQIVRRVLVQDGMQVKQGDVLIEFDSSSASADVTRYLQETKRASTFQSAYRILLQKIESESPEKFYIAKEDENFIDAKLARETIDTRWNEYQAKLDRASAELNRRKSEAESLTVNEKVLQDRLKHQKELEKDFRKMMNAAAIPRHAWIEQDAKLIEIMGELSRIVVQARQVGLAVIEAEASLALVHASERAAWRDRLNESERDISNGSAEHQKAKYRLETNTLIAPVSGKVQQLSIFAPGSVAPSGQQVLAVVPDSEVEEVEVLIENKDIGFVRIGQASEVKMEAFDYTRYGTLPARISYISPDAVADERGVLRYAAKMRLERNILSRNGRTMTISPGMTVFVDIKSGKRSIISYFLSPILKTVSEAAREH